jgi:hypothetical protein
MLIQPDKNELGDLRLDAKEGVAKLTEDIKKQRQKDHIPNQILLEDQEMAVGECMQPAEFIRRLQKFPNVIVEQGGLPNAVRVCTPGIDEDKDSPTYGQTIKKPLACGFYIDRLLPEWSSVVNDKWGVPVREIRGWRSVLLKLMHAGVLTYPQVKAAFGEPTGQRNILWREQTQHRK